MRFQLPTELERTQIKKFNLVRLNAMKWSHG